MSSPKYFEGKDLEEALHTAAAQLKTPEPDLDYEIVDQGRRGLFGMGARNVKIRIKPPVDALTDADIHPGAAADSADGGAKRPRRRRRSKPGGAAAEGTAAVKAEAPREKGRTHAEGDEPRGKRGGRRRGRGRGRGKGKAVPGQAEGGERNRQEVDRAERGETRRRGRGRGGNRGERPSNGRRERQRPADDRPPRPPAPEEAVQAVQEMAAQIFRLMEFNLDVTAEGISGGVLVAVDGADAQHVARRKGELIAAVQFLLNRMQRRAFPEAGRIRVATDSERRRRDDDLVELTREVAQQVFQTGEAKMLHPMNAYERRLVHLTTREFEGVGSSSDGEGAVKTVRIFKDA